MDLLLCQFGSWVELRYSWLSRPALKGYDILRCMYIRAATEKELPQIGLGLTHTDYTLDRCSRNSVSWLGQTTHANS